jgi:hypothetical protein
MAAYRDSDKWSKGEPTHIIRSKDDIERLGYQIKSGFSSSTYVLQITYDFYYNNQEDIDSYLELFCRNRGLKYKVIDSVMTGNKYVYINLDIEKIFSLQQTIQDYEALKETCKKVVECMKYNTPEDMFNQVKYLASLLNIEWYYTSPSIIE